MHTLANTTKSLSLYSIHHTDRATLVLEYYYYYNGCTLVEHPVDFLISFFSGAPFSDTQFAGRPARFHPADFDLRPSGWNPDSEAYRGETGSLM